MNQLNLPGTVRPSTEGLKKLKNAQDSLRLSYPGIVKKIQEYTKTHISEDTVKRFLKGEGGAHRGNAKAIAQVLGLELEDIIELSEAKPPRAKSRADTTSLMSNQTFQEKLDQRQRLTTNPLTGGSGMRFNSKDIYVPLGLVERKQRSRHSGDVSPENGSNLSQPTEYEIARKFERDEFFEQVLKLEESQKAKVDALLLLENQVQVKPRGCSRSPIGYLKKLMAMWRFWFP